jgi:FkbM family methyltransferase
MSFSDFIYRQKQKWKYHTATDLFEKKVADINKHKQIIRLDKSTFSITDCELKFILHRHSFIVDRIDLFMVLSKGRGQFMIDNFDLIYSIDNIRLHVTTSEELYIIHEVFFEGCYTISVKEKFNVIDIGMNVGYTSLFFASNPRVMKIYGYEPFKPTFMDAQKNILLNPQLSSKIVPFNFGLGNEFEKRILHFSSDLKGKNSIYNIGKGNEEIELRKATEIIGDVISRNPTESYFIKMDCEGAEFEIFENLQQGSIPDQIFGFIIEWHQKSPQPIIDILISNNFKVQMRGNDSIGIITGFR